MALDGPEIVALFEFSRDILLSDILRFRRYGVEPQDVRTDVRFGPCIPDGYAGRGLGLGNRLFPCMRKIMCRFGKRRMILWGGVLADNARALRFYEKNEFRLVGRFRSEEGEECWDALLEQG